jgi:drug/metabolite transporter (DMT)-like permease
MTQATLDADRKVAWFYHSYFQLFAGGLCDAAGELLLKHGADAAERIVQASTNATGFFGLIVHTPGLSGLLSAWTWIGIISFVLGLLFWLSVLRTMPLSVAFPVVNVLHMLVPIGAHVLLHEAVPVRRWLGILLAMGGTLLILKPVEAAEKQL